MPLAETQAGAESQYCSVAVHALFPLHLQVSLLSPSAPVLTYSDFRVFSQDWVSKTRGEICLGGAVFVFFFCLRKTSCVKMGKWFLNKPLLFKENNRCRGF